MVQAIPKLLICEDLLEQHSGNGGSYEFTTQDDRRSHPSIEFNSSAQ